MNIALRLGDRNLQNRGVIGGVYLYTQVYGVTPPPPRPLGYYIANNHDRGVASYTIYWPCSGFTE